MLQLHLKLIKFSGKITNSDCFRVDVKNNDENDPANLSQKVLLGSRFLKSFKADEPDRIPLVRRQGTSPPSSCTGKESWCQR
jgi:hypothetical protein